MDAGTAVPVYRAAFGAPESTVPFIVTDVYCTGNEDRLSDCNLFSRHGCSNNQDAGVVCLLTGNFITENYICMHNTSQESKGRMLVF